MFNEQMLQIINLRMQKFLSFFTQSMPRIYSKQQKQLIQGQQNRVCVVDQGRRGSVCFTKLCQFFSKAIQRMVQKMLYKKHQLSFQNQAVQQKKESYIKIKKFINFFTNLPPEILSAHESIVCREKLIENDSKLVLLNEDETEEDFERFEALPELKFPKKRSGGERRRKLVVFLWQAWQAIVQRQEQVGSQKRQKQMQELLQLEPIQNIIIKQSQFQQSQQQKKQQMKSSLHLFNPNIHPQLDYTYSLISNEDRKTLHFSKDFSRPETNLQHIDTKANQNPHLQTMQADKKQQEHYAINHQQNQSKHQQEKNQDSSQKNSFVIRKFQNFYPTQVQENNSKLVQAQKKKEVLLKKLKNVDKEIVRIRKKNKKLQPHPLIKDQGMKAMFEISEDQKAKQNAQNLVRKYNLERKKKQLRLLNMVEEVDRKIWDHVQNVKKKYSEIQEKKKNQKKIQLIRRMQLNEKRKKQQKEKEKICNKFVRNLAHMDEGVKASQQMKKEMQSIVGQKNEYRSPGLVRRKQYLSKIRELGKIEVRQQENYKQQKMMDIEMLQRKIAQGMRVQELGNLHINKLRIGK